MFWRNIVLAPVTKKHRPFDLKMVSDVGKREEDGGRS
jgi:hypothetical protein